MNTTDSSNPQYNKIENIKNCIRTFLGSRWIALGILAFSFYSFFLFIKCLMQWSSQNTTNPSLFLAMVICTTILALAAMTIGILIYYWNFQHFKAVQEHCWNLESIAQRNNAKPANEQADPNSANTKDNTNTNTNTNVIPPALFTKEFIGQLESLGKLFKRKTDVKYDAQGNRILSTEEIPSEVRSYLIQLLKENESQKVKDHSNNEAHE